MNIQNLQVIFISKKQEINHRLYKRTQGPTCHLTHARNLIVGYCWGWFLGHRHSFWDAIWNTRRCEFSYSIHVYKCIVISVGYSDGPQISCFLSQQKTFFALGTSFLDFLGEGWQGVPRDSVRLVLLLPSQCYEINGLHDEPIPRLRWACEQQLQLHVSHGGLLGLGSYHELSTLRKSYKILIFLVCRSDMIRWFSQWKAEFITVYRGFQWISQLAMFDDTGG